LLAREPCPEDVHRESEPKLNNDQETEVNSNLHRFSAWFSNPPFHTGLFKDCSHDHLSYKKDLENINQLESECWQIHGQNVLFAENAQHIQMKQELLQKEINQMMGIQNTHQQLEEEAEAPKKQIELKQVLASTSALLF
jgi:hypothetical protein